MAADWSQWLGNDRDGVWRETGIVESFPETGLPVVWKVSIGGGYSGPSIADGKLFVMDREAEPFDLADSPGGNINFARVKLPGTDRVRCFDAVTGEQLWMVSYESTYTTAFPYAIGPRCTPTVDGDRVYTLGAEGQLKCLAVADGAERWALDLRETHHAVVPDWGFAAHPLVDGDRLICMVGGEDSAVVAFDKHTGAEIWRAGAAVDPGYCPPVIYKIAGIRQLVTWDSVALRGLNPVTGAVYWEVPFAPTYGMAIGMPRLDGRRLYLMAFNNVSGVVEVAEDGKAASVIWRGKTKTGVAGVLNTAWVEGGHVYACGPRGDYTCVDLGTGRRLWEDKGPTRDRTGKRAGSWPSAFTVKHEPSGRFLIANDHGELIWARLSPSGYEELSRTVMIEPTHLVGNRYLVWSHPAFADRKVFVRNDRHLVCLDLAR